MGQQVFRTTTTSVIGYLEYLPADYHSNSNKYPVVFFLHGNGERGVNSTDPSVIDDYINRVTLHGPPKWVKNGTQFPFILISPQLKSNVSNWNTTYIMEVINHCKTYLRIDEKRIYVTGLSLGGGGTWVSSQDQPKLFAAVAPVCGGYNSTSKACGIAAENLPVWAFHGDKDTVVPLSRSENMVNAINACSPTPSPLAKLSIYPGVAHNAWDNAYRPDNTIHTPNVYQWLLSHTNTINGGNKIPSANAGSDKTISTTSTMIYGSGYDADGTISSYLWTKISGPTATLTNSTSKTLSISYLEVGDYVFKLTVTDNSGNTDSDYVRISKVEQTNQVPVSNAGVNKSITLPSNSIEIVGTGSDADGQIVSYKWSKVSGPAVTMTNATTKTLSAANLVAGSYVFRLSVTDDDGAVDTDDMLLKVNAAIAPLVNAGLDKIVKLPTTSISLSGSAVDEGGTIVAYQWSKVSGPSCVLNNSATSTLKLTSLVSGVYVIRLTAKDNDGNTGYDDVTVTVNAPPKANAGSDVVITLPLLSTFVLHGSGTDSDGNIVKYLWSKYSGPNITAQDNNTPDFKLVKLYEGTYVFKFVVTDNTGLTGVDYVTVTVKGEPIITASSASPADVLNDYVKQSSIFGSLDGINRIESSTIAIFGPNGESLYQGPWSLEIEKEVIKEGFYIYNIFQKGERVNSGKIYKKRI